MMLQNVVISFLLALAATHAHPITRRLIGGSGSWPDGSSNCIFSEQPTPLSIKRMLVSAQNSIAALQSQLPRSPCDACVDPVLNGGYVESPAFSLNPHYFMPDTVSHNIISGSTVHQKLPWSFIDHYFSLLSYTTVFNNLTSINGISLLANLSASLQQLVLPELSSIQLQGDGCSHPQEKTVDLSTISTCSPVEQVKCLTRQFYFTLHSFKEHIDAYLNLYPSVKSAVNDIPECAIMGSDPLTQPDFRRMVCSARKVSSETYNLLKAMGSKAVTNCTGSSSISGVPSWFQYYKQNQFPPTTPLNMVPYVSYLKALQEHSEALNSNMSGNCLTPVEENKIIIIRNILTNVTNSFQDWIDTKPCECARSGCTLPSSVTVMPMLLSTDDCPSHYQQLYCLAVNLRAVAESSYLFFNLLPEAEATWSTPCSSLQ